MNSPESHRNPKPESLNRYGRVHGLEYELSAAGAPNQKDDGFSVQDFNTTSRISGFRPERSPNP